MQKYSDAELVAHYIESKGPEFLTELFTRHGDIVYRTALRIMKNPSDAEDILQTVYCKMITNLHLYKGTGSVIGWMLQVVIHTCYNQLQSEKSRHNREKKMMSERVHMTSPKNNELKEMIENHLNKLPEIYKAPITLQIMEGLSIKEVSEALEIPEKTIRSQIARGLEKLKVSLQSVGVTASVVSIGDLLKEIQQPLAPAAINSSQYFNSIIQGKTAVSAKIAVSTGAKGFVLSKAIVLSILSIISASGLFVWYAKTKPNPVMKTIKMSSQKWDFENIKDLDLYQDIGILNGSIAIAESIGINNSNALAVEDKTVIEFDISRYKLPVRISYVTDAYRPTNETDSVQIFVKSNFQKDKKINHIFGLRDRINVALPNDNPNSRLGYFGKWFSHVAYIDEDTIDFFVDGKRSHLLEGASEDNKKVYLLIGKAIIDDLIIESIDKKIMPMGQILIFDKNNKSYEGSVTKYNLDKVQLGLDKNSKAKPYLIEKDPLTLADEVGLHNAVVYPTLNSVSKVEWVTQRQKITKKWDFENTDDIALYQGLSLSKGNISIVENSGDNNSKALSVEEETTILLDISKFKLPIKISYLSDYFASKKDVDYGQVLLKKNNIKDKEIYLVTNMREASNIQSLPNSPNGQKGYFGKWFPQVIYVDEKNIDFWIEEKRTHFLQGTSVDDKKVGLYIGSKVILDNLKIESIDKNSMPNIKDCEDIIASTPFQKGIIKYDLEKEKLGLDKSSKVIPFLQVSDPKSWEEQIGFNLQAIHASLNNNFKVVWASLRQKVSKKWDFENTKNLEQYREIGLINGDIQLVEKLGLDNSKGLEVSSGTLMRLDISKYQLPLKLTYSFSLQWLEPGNGKGPLAFKGKYKDNKNIFYFVDLQESLEAINFKLESTDPKKRKWFQYTIYITDKYIDKWFVGNRSHLIWGASKDDSIIYLGGRDKYVLDAMSLETIEKKDLPDVSFFEKFVSSNSSYEVRLEKYPLTKEIVGMKESSDQNPNLFVMNNQTMEETFSACNNVLYPKIGLSGKVEWRAREEKATKKFEFETSKDFDAFKTIRGNTSVAKGRGENKSDCLGIDAGSVQEIDISAFKLPLKITYSFDCILPHGATGKGVVISKGNLRPDQNVFNFSSLQKSRIIDVSEKAKKNKNENAKDGYVGAWNTRTIYVSEEGIDIWFYGKRSGLLLGESVDNKKLYILELDQVLIDNFTISSIESEAVPDFSEFKKFADSIPFEKGGRGYPLEDAKAKLNLEKDSPALLGIYDKAAIENAFGLDKK